MTLYEYAQQVSRYLVNAYNRKEEEQIKRIFRETDAVLDASLVNREARREFWRQVYKLFEDGGLLIEKQSNSALLALMLSIQREITARTGSGSAK